MFSLLSAVTLSASTHLAAAPITYEGTLSDGVTAFGAVSAAATVTSPSSSLNDYWSFNANPGDNIQIEVNRLENAYDPSLWIFEGNFADDAVFGSDIDGFDPGFIDFADDETAHPGPFGDPVSSFTVNAGSSGIFTAIVTSFSSGADDGDGLFPYQITFSTVSEPALLALFGLGLVGFGTTRRMSNRQA